uniref:Uncharacterized protein n=1 Tax=Glossina brevipalpis TaxID=37001 RepID=A0A1A9W5J7_9MUSC
MCTLNPGNFMENAKIMSRKHANLMKPNMNIFCDRCRKPVSIFELFVTTALDKHLGRGKRKGSWRIKEGTSAVLDLVNSNSSESDDSFNIKKNYPKNRSSIKKTNSNIVILHRNPNFFETTKISKMQINNNETLPQKSNLPGSFHFLDDFDAETDALMKSFHKRLRHLK